LVWQSFFLPSDVNFVMNPKAARPEDHNREHNHDNEEQPQEGQTITEAGKGENLAHHMHDEEVGVARWHRTHAPARQQHRQCKLLQRADNRQHQLKEDDRGHERNGDMAERL